MLSLGESRASNGAADDDVAASNLATVGSTVRPGYGQIQHPNGGKLSGSGTNDGISAKQALELIEVDVKT